MELSILLRCKATCTLEHNVHLGLAPWDLLGLHRLEDRDLVPIDRYGVFRVGDGAVKAPVHRIVLEHVLHVLTVREGVVDRDNLDAVDVQRRPQGHPADAAEPVDSEANRHFRFLGSPVLSFFTQNTLDIQVALEKISRSKFPGIQGCRPDLPHFEGSLAMINFHHL
eukprot:XP_001705044.1 Hypothetical protein GL50803_32421 [Giardia lamblia ATCC 50803]